LFRFISDNLFQTQQVEVHYLVHNVINYRGVIRTELRFPILKCLHNKNISSRVKGSMSAQYRTFLEEEILKQRKNSAM